MIPEFLADKPVVDKPKRIPRDEIRERAVKDHLVKRAKAAGAELRKVTWTDRANAPDWLVMLTKPHVQAIYLELKRPGEHPTEAQYREHERMRAAGFRVYWTDSKAGVDLMFDWLLRVKF